MAEPAPSPDAFADVVGQREVIGQLRAAAVAPVHAYLLVGPSGSGTPSLARGFAAELLCRAAPSDEAERIVELARSGHHPDVHELGAEGSSVRRAEAEAFVAAAVKSPVEGSRKVLIGHGFDQMTEAAAAILLKTVEEPAPSTIFVLLAEDVPPELVTIASRCLRLDVPPLGIDDVLGALVADGVGSEAARSAAEAADGDLDRARVLATDERLELRRQAWLAVPKRLDGTGAAAHRTVEELLSMVDEAMAPLVARQTAEVEAFDAEREAYGLRKGARKDLEDAHKRQQRRFRTGELRYGLALLARRYRQELAEAPRLDGPVRALAAIDAAATSIRFNPNERLQLQVLLLRLGAR